MLCPKELLTLTIFLLTFNARIVGSRVNVSSICHYPIEDISLSKLMDLCVDICRRYEKNKLLWLEYKEKTLSYNPAPDEIVLTVHRWFANKSCPGDWLFSRMGELATKVTDRLSGRLPTTRYYRVRKSWSQPKTQIGAFTLLPNAKECAEKHEGYGVFDDEKLV